jgi:hypothetical protein
MIPGIIIPIPLYLREAKFRIDEYNESIWLERLDESGEPTEDYIEVDDELFYLLVKNNQIEGEG